MKNKMAQLAVALSMMGASVSMARAASVNLDTFQGSSWTVQRVLAGGESDTSAGSFAVQNVSSNPGWVSLPDTNAQWVSWNSATGSGYTGDVNGTGYIYTDTFTLGALPGASIFSLSGSFLVDNYATGVTLTVDGTPVNVTLSAPDPSTVLPPNATEFGYRYSVDVDTNGLFTSPSQFVLTISTVNSYADPGHLADHTNPGPTGFEFSGIASADLAGGSSPVNAVPTPEAAWMGLSLLGGLGGVSMLRKRRAQA